MSSGTQSITPRWFGSPDNALGEQLQDAVDAVHDETPGERADGLPVEVARMPREVRNARGEEEEVQDEFDHPLPPLVQRFARVDVEVADEVDRGEDAEDQEHDSGRTRIAAVAAPGPLERERSQEENRQDVCEPDGARNVPMHLLPRDAEEGREEEGPGDLHSKPRNSSASSSTRAARPSRSRSSGASGALSSSPACQRTCRSVSAAVSPGTSSGATTTPASVSRMSSDAAPSGGTAARIGRSAARYSKTLPDSTPFPRPPASGIRSSSASESR